MSLQIESTHWAPSITNRDINKEIIIMKFHNWKNKEKHPEIFHRFRRLHTWKIKKKKNDCLGILNSNTMEEALKVLTKNIMGTFPTKDEKIMPFWLSYLPNTISQKLLEYMLHQKERVKSQSGSHGIQSF